MARAKRARLHGHSPALRTLAALISTTVREWLMLEGKTRARNSEIASSTPENTPKR
jgi:hypothetical protein